jgi:hypothetical protein
MHDIDTPGNNMSLSSIVPDSKSNSKQLGSLWQLPARNLAKFTASQRCDWFENIPMIPEFFASFPAIYFRWISRWVVQVFRRLPCKIRVRLWHLALCCKLWYRRISPVQHCASLPTRRKRFSLLVMGNGALPAVKF